MREENRYSIDSWVRAIFVILFFLIISSAFSDKPVKQYHAADQQELVSALSHVNNEATAVISIQIPVYQKHWLLLMNRLHVNFSDYHHKIVADNIILTQVLLSLREVHLSIKPLLSLTSYYYLFSENSRELPVLS